MLIKIYITLKKGVLDVEGKAIASALQHNLGFDGIVNVRKGKLIELEINENKITNIEGFIKQICEKLLVNTVMEEYSYDIIT